VLDDLKPASPVAPVGWRPSVQFDEVSGEGVATTQGLISEPNFDDFLTQAGYDPAVYEVVGNTVKTSKWQQREDGEWLTSFRFTFRLKNKAIDLPFLWSQARKEAKKPKPVESDKVFVLVPADWQIGKSASRGGTPELLERIFTSFANIETAIRRGKYERIVILDAGDIIEGIENVASTAQLQSNDISPMQQTDLAASLMWDLIKLCAKYAPITYATVGSNHCQWRVNKQAVGRPGVDDWGIVIAQQLRRLATETKTDVTFVIPQAHDETLTLDPFGDTFHILGLFHGHQAKGPNGVQGWLEKQAFGNQPIKDFSIAVSGHFHHTRIEELGKAHNGGSRWWIQASTSDNGSDWYRLSSGSDSGTGISCFELQRNTVFGGTVWRF
jgi:hypothetical protein